MAPRRRVLVVDDDPEIRSTVALLLSARFDVTEASSGHEALQKAAAEPCALALVDYEMPGMSGIELVGRLKERSPELVIVMLTSSRELETAKRALSAGAAEFVTKPFDPAYLRSELGRLLGAPELKEEDAEYRPWKVV